jgi:hypothetical protein
MRFHGGDCDHHAICYLLVATISFLESNLDLRSLLFIGIFYTL